MTLSTGIPVTVTAAPVNAPPSVGFTSPANNQSFTAPAAIALNATAADTDGTIAKVEFFNGATLLATVTGAPYNASWNNVAAGSYTLFARATDNGGAIITSAAVNITVAGNTAPTVTAGATPATAAKP